MVAYNCQLDQFKIPILFDMKSDKIAKDQTNFYYPSINEDYSQYEYKLQKDEHQQKNNHIKEHFNSHKQYQENYRNQYFQQGKYVQNNMQYQGVPVHFENQNKQYIQHQHPYYNHNVNYINENQQINPLQPHLLNRAPLPPKIIRTRITRLQATMEGQFYACQKCGYQGNGTISYRVGTKVCLWGLGLLAFTGVFWWIPCICDDCKDIDIYCGRCRYRKAIVQADCC